MYELRKIPQDKIPWDKIESCYDHISFKSKAWINHLTSNYNVKPYILEVYEEKKTIGYFIAEKFKRIVTVIASPFEGWQTPFQGLGLFESISVKQRIEIYNCIIEFLFRNKECSFFQAIDWHLDLPYVAHSNLRYEIIKGYVLDLRPPLEEIFKRMSSSAKNPIKAAKGRGIIIREPENINLFIKSYYDQLTDVFAKQQLKPTHSIKDISCQITSMAEIDKILMLEAISTDNNSIASSFFVFENNVAFWLGSASLSKYQKLSPNEPLMFEAIKLLKNRGITTIELGGGRNYKEKYGPTPYVRPQIIASRFNGFLELKQIAKKIYYLTRSLRSKFKFE